MTDRMNLKVGQLVYTMYTQGNGSKVEIVEIPEKKRTAAFSNKKGWYFRVKPLENFNFFEGWVPYQNRKDGKLRPEVVTVPQDRIFLCLRDLIPALEEARRYYLDGNHSDALRLKQQKRWIEKALIEAEDRHRLLTNINFAAILGLDTYISPFTGKVV